MKTKRMLRQEEEHEGEEYEVRKFKIEKKI